VDVDTHGRWPWAAAASVVPAWAVAAARRRELGADDLWVAALAFPILVSHQTEEWVRPGGFLPFCNQRLLGSGSPEWPLTERIGFHVNVTAGWSSALLALGLWSRTPAPAAGVLWMEAGNVAMHVGTALRTRSYNPGTVTAGLLMAPHAIAGARAISRSGRLTRRGKLSAAATGLAFASLPLAMKARMWLGGYRSLGAG
jgi:hypothetical protein